jgi:hypothetical protein
VKLRPLAAAGIAILALLAIPVGTFDPTPRSVEPQRFDTGACDVLDSSRAEAATSADDVTTAETTISQEEDPLGSSQSFVARSSCDYQFVPSCVSTQEGLLLTALSFDVIVMPDEEAAHERYEAARILNTKRSTLHEQTFRDYATPIAGYSVATAPRSRLVVLQKGRNLAVLSARTCDSDGADPAASAGALYQWATTVLPDDVSLR